MTPSALVIVQNITADIVLSGDRSLAIATQNTDLSPELRKKECLNPALCLHGRGRIEE